MLADVLKWDLGLFVLKLGQVDFGHCFDYFELSLRTRALTLEDFSLSHPRDITLRLTLLGGRILSLCVPLVDDHLG